MSIWTRFRAGMQEPQNGDRVIVPKGATMIHHGKSRKDNYTKLAKIEHTISVVRVIPGECVLTTTGIGVIKEVSLTDIIVEEKT